MAAPTAGLHFTQGLVERLRDRGIGLHKVTLHVGAGTFLPVNGRYLGPHDARGIRDGVAQDGCRAE